jgi:hypothetical protein
MVMIVEGGGRSDSNDENVENADNTYSLVAFKMSFACSVWRALTKGCALTSLNPKH